MPLYSKNNQLILTIIRCEPQSLLDEIMEISPMEHMRIRSKIRDYEIHFVNGDEFVSSLSRYLPCCYVVDDNVWGLYRDGVLKSLESERLVIQYAHEEQKTLTGAQRIYDELIKHSAKRNLTLVSIGGGMIQDLSGFVAATLYRGINWVYVPTTLLAQADSCLGSKTSLNYRNFKNLLGTFYPPNHVIIYTPFVQTLSELDFMSGLGEVIKLHLIGGLPFVEKIAKCLDGLQNRDEGQLIDAIQDSLNIKYPYVASDEFDQGERILLNYGHCFGHAIESVSNFQMPHGLAVVLGMMLANIVAKKRDILSDLTENFLFEQLFFPVVKIGPILNYLDPEAIIEAMKKDKKRTGNGLALIILKEKYNLEIIQDLSPKEVVDAIQELSSKFMNRNHSNT